MPLTQTSWDGRKGPELDGGKPWRKSPSGGIVAFGLRGTAPERALSRAGVQNEIHFGLLRIFPIEGVEFVPQRASETGDSRKGLQQPPAVCYIITHEIL